MECNKKSLPFVYILMTAICSILLLGWAFVSVPTEYGLSATISGFGIIGQWGSVWLVFSALFQIFSIISLVLILITTIWGWLFSAGKAKELKVGSWGLKAISEFLFTIFVGLVILVFIFWTIGVQNVTVGLILYLLINLVSFVTYIILRQKNVIEREGMFESIASKSRKKSENKVIEVQAEQAKNETESESQKVKAEENKEQTQTSKTANESDEKTVIQEKPQTEQNK